jgi:hypothetical protein
MDLKKAYKALGCEFNSSREDYKKKYHELSLKYHPDRNYLRSEKDKVLLEEKFKEISNAYDFLENYKLEKNDNFSNIPSPNYDNFSEKKYRNHSYDYRYSYKYSNKKNSSRNDDDFYIFITLLIFLAIKAAIRAAIKFLLLFLEFFYSLLNNIYSLIKNKEFLTFREKNKILKVLTLIMIFLIIFKIKNFIHLN